MKGRRSTSPQIGHRRGRLDRFGNTTGPRAPTEGYGLSQPETAILIGFDRFEETKGRRCPKGSYNLRRPESAILGRASIGSETPKVEGTHERATIYDAPNQPT